MALKLIVINLGLGKIAIAIFKIAARFQGPSFLYEPPKISYYK